MPLPRSAIAIASGGCTSKCVRPTKRLPAPSAKNNSVVAGFSETIRRGDTASEIVSEVVAKRGWQRRLRRGGRRRRIA